MSVLKTNIYRSKISTKTIQKKTTIHLSCWPTGFRYLISHSKKKAFATNKVPNIASFVAIDEHLYVINTNKLAKGLKVWGPNEKKKYPKPKLLFKYKTGPSISTPIIVQNKIIAATYTGIYLFEHDKKMNFKLLAHYPTGSIESTPVVHNKRIYVASRDGFLYCFGEKN